MLVIPQILEIFWEYYDLETADEDNVKSLVYSWPPHSLFMALSPCLELVPGIGATQALPRPARFPDLLVIILKAKSLL